MFGQWPSLFPRSSKAFARSNNMAARSQRPHFPNPAGPTRPSGSVVELREKIDNSGGHSESEEKKREIARESGYDAVAQQSDGGGAASRNRRQVMSNAVANGFAGAGAGIVAQIITYPLQIVNTRQQTERTAKRNASVAVAVDGDAAEGESSRKGTLFQMLQVIKTEGWGGLYSGLTPSLVGTAASQGIYYFFYQVLKNKAEAIAVARKKKMLGDGSVGMFSWLVVAAIAGSINVLLTIPIWVLVTRMQTHTQAERKIKEAKREAILREASNNNPVEVSAIKAKLAELDLIKPRPYGTILAMQEVYHEAGIRGFWKGIIPTLIMVCNPSIQFMIYETSLKRLQAKRTANKHGVKPVTALEVFLLGALAKLGATVVTYPLLVVKSRLQAKQEIGKNSASRYTGTIDAIVKMIRYEGLRGFYKGMGTKIVQSVFAASVLFMVKEELVKAYLILADGRRRIIKVKGDTKLVRRM